MKHLSELELSGVLDGHTRGEKLWRAQQHLERCGACRDALAALGAQDVALRASLTHDPGEAYFESFADRVAERMSDTGKSRRPARASEVLGAPFPAPWWQRPRVLATAGTLAAVIAGAGIVLLASRNAPLPSVASRDAIDRALESSAPATTPAPDSASTPLAAGEPSLPPGAESGAAPEPLAGGAQPSRLQKVVTTPSGEERAEPARAPRPSAPGESEPAPGSRAERLRATERMRAAKRAALGANESSGARESIPPPAESETSAVRDEAGAPASNFAAPPAASSTRLTLPAPSASRQRLAAPSSPPVRSDAADAAPRQVCGMVRDGNGRPLAAVVITAIDAPSSATSDRQGRFCIELPASSRAVQLMAVGFRSARLDVPAGTGELVATLHAVSALDGGATAALQEQRRASEPGGPAPMSLEQKSAAGDAPEGVLGGDDAALRALPDSLREAAAAAVRLQAGAASLGRAGGYDAAATAWERLLPMMPAGRSELEARARLAECRYRAWLLRPDARRAERAVEALTAFAARSTMGEKRSLSVRWLDRIRSH